MYTSEQINRVYTLYIMGYISVHTDPVQIHLVQVQVPAVCLPCGRGLSERRLPGFHSSPTLGLSDRASRGWGWKGWGWGAGQSLARDRAWRAGGQSLAGGLGAPREGSTECMPLHPCSPTPRAGTWPCPHLRRLLALEAASEGWEPGAEEGLRKEVTGPPRAFCDANDPTLAAWPEEINGKISSCED